MAHCKQAAKFSGHSKNCRYCSGIRKCILELDNKGISIA